MPAILVTPTAYDKAFALDAVGGPREAGRFFIYLVIHRLT